MDIAKRLLDYGMARTNANLIFQCHVGDLVLPAQVKLAFYRIAQEAVNNAIKHGKPANIQCTLCDNEQTVEMLIQDDGMGFLMDKVSDDHFGLQIMRERAEQAGLKLVVTSQPGTGTFVNVDWKKEII
jgi:signal transduction histidine kinase